MTTQQLDAIVWYDWSDLGWMIAAWVVGIWTVGGVVMVAMIRARHRRR